jgi:hypothetical protein
MSRPRPCIFPATRSKHSENSADKFADHFQLRAHTRSMMRKQNSSRHPAFGYGYRLPAANDQRTGRNFSPLTPLFSSEE